MRQGSLCLRGGVLYVGRHAKTAEVRPYDLDGRPLGAGFTFAGAPRATACGLAIDGDHRLWVADTVAQRVRVFSVFGREGAPLGHAADVERDVPGALGPVVDVAIAADEEELEIVAASRGTRRHALQVLRPDGGLVSSLRPLGDPRGQFRELTGVDVCGRWLFACEERGGRVQVFRDREFHFPIQVPMNAGARFAPRAVAGLPDGRSVVAQGGEVSALLLVDTAGGVERVLAEHGLEDGRVFEPDDVVVHPGEDDRHTRVIVLDRDGDRVQVFSLDGRSFGAFLDLPIASV